MNNDSSYLFGFNVSTNQSITEISMNITNKSGFQLLFQNQSTAGFISGSLHTGTNKTFIGTFIIRTATDSTAIKKIWLIGQDFVGDYSLHKQMSLYMNYEFQDFLRLLIVLSLIVGTLIFMSSNEIGESAEAKIAVTVLLVWGFSVVGWLTTGIDMTGEGNITRLAQFGSQYAIAILSTLAGVGFFVRRLLVFT